MVSLVFGRFWEPVLHLVQLISTHCLPLYCWNMLKCFLQMSHRSHPGPPFTVPAVSVILFFEKVFVRLGWRGMVCRVPFSFTANAAEAGSFTCFCLYVPFWLPTLFSSFFIAQDHVDALCYGTSRFIGFLSFGQHTIFLCVQNARFLTCPKCKDTWWTISLSPMFQCVLIRKSTCHAVRELQPYFQLPSIVWVSKRFGLSKFWTISFCAAGHQDSRNHDQSEWQVLGGRVSSSMDNLEVKLPSCGWLKLLYFVWSPPWHLYIFLLANLLAFYLTYLLAFYLAYLLAFYLANLLAFYLAYLLAFYLTYLLAFYLAYLLAFYLTYLLAFYLTFHLAYLLAFYLAVEVRQCPLGSGARGWGPAVPTGIWSSRLRSGSAHCDLEVAVEVRQCPLRSATRGWGPAVPSGIWSSRWRSGCAHWDLDCEEEAAGEEAEEAEEEEKSSVKI